LARRWASLRREEEEEEEEEEKEAVLVTRDATA
jgi:hypothetical protein